MGESDFFSFGDEELGADSGTPWADPNGTSSAASAVLDLPEDEFEQVLEPSQGFESAGHIGHAKGEKRVQRPRGDSDSVSSVKRKPSSRRVHGLVLLAMVVGAIAIARVVLSSTGTGLHDGAPPQPAPSVISQAKLERGGSARPVHTRPTLSRHSQVPAVERQRVKKKMAQTRRRARRRRSPHGQSKRASAPPPTSIPPVEASESASGSAEAPSYEPSQSAPAPAANPSESSGGGSALHDGSSSPEFGL
jgi:hypothetical protein